MPRVGTRSLCATGSPKSGPAAWPRASAASFSRASASARAAVRVTIAFTFGLTRSICARCAWTTSVTETSRARMRRASSTAVEKQRSWLMGAFPHDPFGLAYRAGSLASSAHERDADARPLRGGNRVRRLARPAGREPQDHRPRYVRRRARGHPAALGSARIARTAVGLETVRGFHNPGTQGPFGAAAAAGKLYRFDAERLTDALGIAGSSSAGLLEFAWSGGDTKRLHLGRAAQLGLESALLARQGVRGPATVLEGRSGYFNAFSTPPRLEALVDGLGTAWAIEPPSLKSYATHVTQQAVVQAIQDLKRERPLDPRAITRVVI